MALTDRLVYFTADVDEPTAEELQRAPSEWHQFEIRPPADTPLPAALPQCIHATTEPKTKWLGLRNASSPVAFTIARPAPETLQFRVAVPNRRMDRELRNSLLATIPEVELASVSTGLPVREGDTVGGGYIAPNRPDWYPLRTEFEDPPTNQIVAALGRDVMRDARFVIQILLQPAVGRPIRRKWWRRKAARRIAYLRNKKEKLTYSRSATPAERDEADTIEKKMRSFRFHASIRVLVAGSDYTRSRLLEAAAPFSIFDSAQSKQSLVAVPAQSLRENGLREFARAVHQRRFGRRSLPFQVSVDEAAALISLPDHQQPNIQYAQP